MCMLTRSPTPARSTSLARAIPRAYVTLITVFLLALALTPASASATSTASDRTALAASAQNTAATHAYIRADYAFLHATNALITPAQNDVVALNQRLGQECPRVGAGSPQNAASEPMSNEVVVALWSVTFGADAGPIHTFYATVSRLHWTNSKLTGLAHAYVTSLNELASLPLPALCNDVRSWTASDFHTVPADTTAIDHQAASIEPHSVPRSALAPYELPADRPVLARATHLETKLLNIETTTGFSDWDMVLATLGLNQ
jgi:hypothetical protein